MAKEQQPMSFSFDPTKSHCEAIGCASPPQYRMVESKKELCSTHANPLRDAGENSEPLISGFKIIEAPKLKIKAEKPGDLSQFIGKTMRMMDGQMVKIEKIQGSIVKESRFEVNNAHHIVILDAFKQLNKDKSITQEQIDAFDAIEHEVVKIPTKDGVANGQTHAN